jgi:hypothetical protein
VEFEELNRLELAEQPRNEPRSVVAPNRWLIGG